MGMRKTLNALLAPIGFTTIRVSDLQQLAGLKRQALIYKDALVREVAEKFTYTCQNGPFKGLKLPEVGAWSDYDIAAKIIGSYECELFEALEDIIAHKPTSIINIGASEGYYAVGLKQRCPESDVYTYDIDINSFDALATCQKLNNAEVTRLEQFSFSNPFEAIENQGGDRPLFVVDCEGCEQEIVDFPPRAMEKTSFLIELHDLFVPRVTNKLTAHLKDTHSITILDETARNIYDYPELSEYQNIQKAIIVDEYRGGLMQWLYATPKAS